jgi:RNA 2',3'-cyclic 3'-phosphodiesterase
LVPTSLPQVPGQVRMDMERLFLAVQLPLECRSGLARRLAELAPRGLPGRGVPADRWHFTLRFLGSIPPILRAALDRELESAILGEAFEIELGVLGAFPRPSRASVLWMGVQRGSERLSTLASEVERAVSAAGFPPEERPFRPHLTLARFKVPEDVAPLVQRCTPVGILVPVSTVTLFRSHLEPGAARYEPLAEWPLSR